MQSVDSSSQVVRVYPQTHNSLIGRETFVKHRPTSFHDLPVELLLEIFKEVYQELYNGFVIPEIHFEQQLSSSFFPYSFAAVCLRWKSVLAMVPYFWKRVVIKINENGTSLSDVRSVLQWSADLPIDVLVSRNDKIDISHSVEESSVAAVSKLLIPHLHRCKSLVFRLLHAASVPLLGLDLYGHADHLTDLQFIAEKDDFPRSRNSSATEYKHMIWSNIGDVTIDSLNFYNMFIHKSGPHPPALRHLSWLSISNYAGGSSKPTELSLRDTFRVLEQLPLRVLTISNVEFRLDLSEDAEGWEKDLSEITFENINSEALAAFLRVVNAFGFLQIRRCDLAALYDGIPYSRTLVLDEVITEDITPYLRTWSGICLCLDNCSFLDDGFFENMTKSDPWICPNLNEIYIQQCSPLLSSHSGSLICRMIMERFNAALRCLQSLDSPMSEGIYSTIMDVSAIQDITLMQSGHIQKKQEKRIRKLVERFNYYPDDDNAD